MKMNKKRICKVLIIIAVLIFTGCKNSDLSGNIGLDNTMIIETDTSAKFDTMEDSDTTIESTTTNQTTYMVITEQICETEDYITRELEYPQIVGEDEKYNNINKTIKDIVFSFNSPDWEITDITRERYFSCLPFISAFLGQSN